MGGAKFIKPFFFSGQKSRQQVSFHIFLKETRQKQVPRKFIFENL